MIKQLSVLFFGVVLLAFVFGGCSDETVQPTVFEQGAATTLVEGDIDPDGGDFEYIVPSAGEGDDQPGPFAIIGTNIHYVDSLSVLSVDFKVDNRGDNTYAEPVTMTFIKLLPDSVTVENPDNDEHGAGAMIRFHFANRDNVWSPDEESLVRTVHFGVGEGVSIGFVARLDVGMDETRGSIGGIVWNDADEDGEMNSEEEGVGGVEIHLTNDVPEDSMRPEVLWQTRTASDGTYRFDGLDAGFYHVMKAPNDRCRPTTPTTIEVVLVESNGDVSDFLLADFGCVAAVEPPPDRIEIGDWVAVTGEYEDDPDRIMAWGIDVVRCNVEPPPPDTLRDMTGGWDGDHDWDGHWDDGHDWDDCDRCEDWGCWGLKNELRGPVTAVDRDQNAVAVMGTWVSFSWCDSVPNDTIPDDSMLVAAYHGDGDGGDDDGDDYDRRHRWKWLHPDSVEVGDRVRVRVFQKPDNDKLYGYFLKEWIGTPEKVFGRVEWVSSPSGPIDAIRVLGLDVMITARTEIHFKR
jgi:hypothetical protein